MTAAHTGTATARSCARTAASRVNSPPPGPRALFTAQRGAALKHFEFKIRNSKEKIRKFGI
jgi:hypothetical protein